MTRVIFWASATLVAWTYAAFPVLLLLRALLRPRPVRAGAVTPSVSVVIAARNEADAIGAKLDSVAALDYPADRLEVLVASDGSEDGTAAAVRERAGGPAVVLLELPRIGKAAALNAAVDRARGEILVFTDANSRFAPGALRALVARFADPEVGGVAGDQRYVTAGDEAAVADGERGYWSLDRALKRAESRAGHVISATGAIYAIRRSLFEPVAEGVTDDFTTSTAVIARGARLVFAPEAVAYEPVGRTAQLEFERKVRVMTRGLQGVVLRRALLDPRRHGFYAVQLLSHKVLRRLMAVPLALMALAAVRLAPRSAPFRALALVQGLFYAAGAGGLAAGRAGRRAPRALALPAYFCLVNAASLRAALNVARGRRIDRWEPRR